MTVSNEAKGPWLWPNSEVTRVIDGDTVIARLTRDIGFHGVTQFEQHLRLARVDAYPYNKSNPSLTPKGEKATQFTYFHLVADVANKGKLLIETLKPYAYGDEWMAEITLPNGSNLSDLLLAEGLALPYDGKGKRPASEALLANRELG